MRMYDEIWQKKTSDKLINHIAPGRFKSKNTGKNAYTLRPTAICTKDVHITSKISGVGVH
ncbi:hypothetical protein A6J63_020755 [Yersinia enterocolitica]|nr:hypothetical protein A6J63_020755 [Yersinia enterocolitica]